MGGISTRIWRPGSDLPPLTHDGSTRALAEKAHGPIALWSCGDGENAASDIQVIQQDPTLTATEREQLAKARVGHGRFRSKVLAHWRNTCPVTGCSDQRVLVASHIKRWCDSDNGERLDPFNGLALTPNVDRLFDRHLISFDDSGALVLSERADEGLLARLSVPTTATISLHERHRPYMAAHRERMRMLDDGVSAEA